MLLRSYMKITGLSLAFSFATYLVVPMLSPYLSSLGYSTFAISLFFAVFPLIVMLSAVFIGDLSEELGKFWTIEVSLLLLAAAYVMYIIAAPWSIVIGRLIDALGYSAVSVLLIAQLQDMLSENKRGEGTGVVLSIAYLARLVAPLVGGVLAARAYKLPFIASTCIFLGMAFFLRHEHYAHKNKVDFHPLKDIKRFFQEKRLRPFILLGPAMDSVSTAATVFLPLYLVIKFGVSLETVGFVFMIFGSALLLEFFFGHLADRWGPDILVVLGVACFGASIFLLGLVHTLPAFCAVIFLAGASVSMWDVSAWSSLSSRTTDRGVVAGTYISITRFGGVVGSLVAGAIVTFFGYNALFFSLGIMLVVAAGIGHWMFLQSKLITQSA